MIIVTVARKPLAATSVAANVLEHGTGALHIDAARIATVGEDAYAGLTVGTGDPGALNPGCGPSFPHHKENWGAWTAKAQGRWPANLILAHLPECSEGDCAPGCPIAHLDEQSGDVPTGSWVRHTDGAHPFGNAVGSPHQNWKVLSEKGGGASRYFKQVRR
jgi:site-specific DNA-methyltransferase (adenine-specific)